MQGVGISEVRPARDGVVRAITHDGAFRVVAACTTETVRGAMRAQNVHGPTAKHFGELLTGAILVREAMAPQLRVQGILKGASGRGSLVADSYPDGSSRGLVNFGSRKEELDVTSGALLKVMRTLPSGSLHQGVVEVPTGGGVSGALMAYLQDSEQVVSVISVSALVDDAGDLVAAGGYLVQLLPEVERGPLMVMTERLQNGLELESVLRSDAGSAEGLVDEVLYGMPYSRVGEAPLRFECRCSETRLLASLATLPPSDIEEMLDDGEMLEIRCDYCGREYALAPEALRSIVTTN
ncbi:MAG TPA: Hsp33 family molecular chaperone HslO [Minicystis sp.]|nr:Hsp33 family molecular chaperone HslO [Minicystis sp.]